MSILRRIASFERRTRDRSDRTDVRALTFRAFSGDDRALAAWTQWNADHAARTRQSDLHPAAFATLVELSGQVLARFAQRHHLEAMLPPGLRELLPALGIEARHDGCKLPGEL